MALKLGPRRAEYIDIAKEIPSKGRPLSEDERTHFETFDLIYRSLCAALFNYVPMSGHPGGSLSSGRIVTGVLFDTMDYQVADPDRVDAQRYVPEAVPGLDPRAPGVAVLQQDVHDKAYRVWQVDQFSELAAVGGHWCGGGGFGFQRQPDGATFEAQGNARQWRQILAIRSYDLLGDLFAQRSDRFPWVS